MIEQVKTGKSVIDHRTPYQKEKYFTVFKQIVWKFVGASKIELDDHVTKSYVSHKDDRALESHRDHRDRLRMWTAESLVLEKEHLKFMVDFEHKNQLVRHNTK